MNGLRQTRRGRGAFIRGHAYGLSIYRGAVYPTPYILPNSLSWGRLRLPIRITHSGSPPLKRPEAAIPLVFSGESHFRAPNGVASLAVGKRSGCVFQTQGRTIWGLRHAVSIRERAAHHRRTCSSVPYRQMGAR